MWKVEPSIVSDSIGFGEKRASTCHRGIAPCYLPIDGSTRAESRRLSLVNLFPTETLEKKKRGYNYSEKALSHASQLLIDFYYKNCQNSSNCHK
ncbi:hypothetical protein O9992_18740 [Vibrio lentus]|nr:hypothetical protein [Vibrio lentus]